MRDGEVREMQQEYGAVYKKSLGVPIISLQNIAEDYASSHDLAGLLWDFGGREQTLMAALLEEPEKVQKEQLEVYLLKMHTPELWEQITRQLLRRLPDISILVEEWLRSAHEVLHIFAVLSLGYLPELFSEEMLQELMRLEVKEGSYLGKCLQRVLLKIGIRDKNAFRQMRQHLKMHARYPSLMSEIAEFHA